MTESGNPRQSDAWLPTEEVARLLGWSRWTIQRRLGEFEVRSALGRGGSSGKRYEIALSSLPEPIRARYLNGGRDPEPKPIRTVNLAEYKDRLGDQVIGEALQRERTVKIAMSTGREGKAALAAQAGISLATLYRWISEYEEGGFIAMLPNLPDRPGHGARTLTEEARKFILGHALQELQPPIQWVYEQYIKEAQERGWPIASRATVFRFVASQPKPLMVMGREGEEAYKHKCMPKCRRTYDDLAVNEWWVGDHHEFDFPVSYGGRIIRPSLTAWMDLRSRVIVGWCINLQPSSETICMAFRHGVLAKPGVPFSGLPACAYMDNGNDYKSHRLNDLDGVFSMLDIEVHHCKSYYPEAKAIERFFGTVKERFSRFQPGFLGGNPKERPACNNDARIKEMDAKGELVTLPEVVESFGKWLSTDYHVRIHSELHMPPLQAYETTKKAREDMPDARALDVLLMKTDRAAVYPQGIRRFNHVFWADELANHVGRELVIRFDPNRIGELLVFEGRQYLCTATCNELLSMNATEEQLAKHCRMQRAEIRRIRKEIEGYRRGLEDIVAVAQDAGATALCGPVVDKGSKVTRLTGLERAGRSRLPIDIAPARARKGRDMADELIMAYAERAIRRAEANKH
ncbi:MAG: DDE-type integrase/transposase/recombinase [Firmicutes bacterium]|nr:DDE-type integrase/transposase/recombinase [Bacillota bacterium]